MAFLAERKKTGSPISPPEKIDALLATRPHISVAGKGDEAGTGGKKAVTWKRDAATDLGEIRWRETNEFHYETGSSFGKRRFNPSEGSYTHRRPSPHSSRGSPYVGWELFPSPITSKGGTLSRKGRRECARRY